MEHTPDSFGDPTHLWVLWVRTGSAWMCTVRAASCQSATWRSTEPVGVSFRHSRWVAILLYFSRMTWTSNQGGVTCQLGISWREKGPPGWKHFRQDVGRHTRPLMA